MADPNETVDLQGIAKLISGEGIAPERQVKIYAIGQLLGVRPDDPMFAMLVLLEVHAALFSGVPDRMAAAAKEAAADVGAAARETTRQVIAETVTETVDQRAFARRFRTWAVGTLVGIMLITIGFNYATFRVMSRVGANSEEAFRDEVNNGTRQIQVAFNETQKRSTEAARQAALDAAEALSKYYEDKFASDLKNSVDLQVAAGLKLGHGNAKVLGVLLRWEDQRPGTLNAINSLGSTGWYALTQANPNGPCQTQSYDGNQQRKTCILWMP